MNADTVMNKKKFEKRLNEFLKSELSDYDFKYKIEWDDCEDMFNVKIKRNGIVKNVSFRYNEIDDELLLDIYGYHQYIVREFDHTVKYFWMLIAPAFFPKN